MLALSNVVLCTILFVTRMNPGHLSIQCTIFRSIKTGQSGFVPGPSSAGKQGPPSSSSGRSFSPAGSRPKTSPTSLNSSPHRNEHSPAAKSPLLGTAPPGLLPPPDKGTCTCAYTYKYIQTIMCMCMYQCIEMLIIIFFFINSIMCVVKLILLCLQKKN